MPKGFVEEMGCGMISYVVPHSIYPKGYHCNPSLALPFISLASQKNYITLYHMGIYSDQKILQWFTNEYSKICKYKIDMGKGCIRFKKFDDIPFSLIGKLIKQISVNDWINTYETLISKNIKK